MKSCIVKRSIVISGHKTSISLEDAFWRGLKDIARGRQLTLSEMVALIDAGRAEGNLSSAVRLFVLDHYRTVVAIAPAADEQGSQIEKTTREPDPAAIDRT